MPALWEVRCSGASIRTRRPSSSTSRTPRVELEPLREDVQLDLDRPAAGAEANRPLVEQARAEWELGRAGLDGDRPLVGELRHLAEPAPEHDTAVVDVDRLGAEGGEVLRIADRVDDRAALAEPLLEQRVAARHELGLDRVEVAADEVDGRVHVHEAREQQPLRPVRLELHAVLRPLGDLVDPGELLDLVPARLDHLPRPVEEARGELDRLLAHLAGDVDLGGVEERSHVAADEDAARGRGDETGDHPEQRAPGAGVRADEAERRACGQLEAELPDRGEPAVDVRVVVHLVIRILVRVVVHAVVALGQSHSTAHRAGSGRATGAGSAAGSADASRPPGARGARPPRARPVRPPSRARSQAPHGRALEPVDHLQARQDEQDHEHDRDHERLLRRSGRPQEAPGDELERRRQRVVLDDHWYWDGTCRSCRRSASGSTRPSSRR